MLEAITTIFKTSRIVRGLTMLLAGFIGLQAWGAYRERQGAQKTIAAINKQTEQINVKAKEARKRGAAEPDPVEWMRRHRCAGC